MKSYCTDYINRNGGHVHAIECDRDHMHIMAELPTTISVAFFLGSLKGNSAKFAQREFKDYLKQFYWGEKQSLWSDSYFVASTGGVTIDVIKKYVESQPTKKRPRGRQKRTEDNLCPFVVFKGLCHRYPSQSDLFKNATGSSAESR